MAITIDRAQRDAIYTQVVTDLSGVDDISHLLRKGDIAAALRHRRWFEDDMRLLDDLHWERDTPAEQFELTMPTVDLARLFGRLNDEAGTMLKDHFAETADERDDAQRLLLARTAYGHVLAQLASDALTNTPAQEPVEPGPQPHRPGEADDSIGHGR
jgi:predicted DNA-binding WGR domain protein